jgi:epoxyqueuosine reductase
MEWMESRLHHRRSPQGLWDEARSVIALGMSYAPEADPLALAGSPDRARISVYAQGGDYHDTVKKALKALARWLVAEADKRKLGPAGVKVFVDTAPVMEKPLGQAAGARLAGQAHQSGQPRSTAHGCSSARSIPRWRSSRISRGRTIADRAGLPDACPTQAFPAPYQLDARRCISYLTIEHKGPIPLEFRKALGNRIYGCDDCLAVCPWNKFAQSAAAMKAFLPRAELAAPKLADLLALDDTAFRQLFSGSPIKRIGRNRFVRNCLYAAGNSGDAGSHLPAMIRRKKSIRIC